MMECLIFAVKLHSTNTENAGRAYKNMKGDTLVPPFTDEKRLELGMPPFPQFTHKDFDFNCPPNHPYDAAFLDIIIGGIGWVSLTGRGSYKLRIHYPGIHYWYSKC